MKFWMRAMSTTFILLGWSGFIVGTALGQPTELRGVSVEFSPQTLTASDGSSIEIREDCFVISIESKAEMATAIRWAKEQLQKVRKENPQVRTEVFVLAQANESQKAEYATNAKAIEMAEELGWGNVAGLQAFEQIKERGTEKEKVEWARHEALGKSIAGEDTPVMVAHVPRVSKAKKWFMVVTRALAVGSVVGWSASLKEAVLPEQVIVPAAASGLMSGTLMYNNRRLMDWARGKGWLKPSKTEKTGFIESHAKMGAVGAVYYTTVNALKYSVGMAASVAAPVYGTIESLLTEAPTWVAMAEMTRAPQLNSPWRRETYLNRAEWGGFGFSVVATSLVVASMANESMGGQPLFSVGPVKFGIERVGLAVISLTSIGFMMKYRWQVMKETIANWWHAYFGTPSPESLEKARADLAEFEGTEEEYVRRREKLERLLIGGGSNCNGLLTFALGG